MMASRQNYSNQLNQPIVALDIGGGSTRVLVASVDEGVPRYRGHGIVDSAGMRKGMIAELGPAARAVRAASERAEDAARINIEHCVVGVGGPHIRGINTSGGFDLGVRMREITRDDVRVAVESARAVARPPDREILHLLPRQFILDSQPGISDPVGMIGARLEVDLHIATCSGSALQSTVTCANRAGLEVTEGALESIASAESTVSTDERELGVCLLDIGAHSSDLAVFFEGAVVYTASVPIGGAHFTSDLAIGLQMSVAEAEQLKRRYGNCVVTAVPELDEIEIGNDGSRRLRLRSIAEILEPRARELLYFVKESLRYGRVENALGAGCVLTGGGSLLPGLLDVTESQLRAPARIGVPVRLSRMPAELAAPEYAALIGMILYAHRTRASRTVQGAGLRARLRSVFAASF